MAFKIQDGGTLRTIRTLYIRQSGINRRIRTLKVQDGGVLRTVAIFADPLTASISPASVSGFEADTKPTLVTTGTATALPTGGLAPFTYSWALLSGAAATINSPASASTTFKIIVGPDQTETAVFRVTVTDAFGQTATADVDATFANIGDIFV